MYIRLTFFTAYAVLLTVVSFAQVADSGMSRQLDDVVITATRSERKMGNVAIPTQVITAQAIKATGSLRLQDILQEQTGLTIVNSPLGISLAGYPNVFGAGVQMQGLDPAYTLILIDGEPLAGRNAGILKLGRIATGNIRQIEIVKGPSSSLYGADAMAGVINIITEKPVRENAGLQLHHASNNTWSVAGSYSNRFKKSALQLFANRYTTAGYDLDKSIYGKTVDPYTDNTFGVKLTQYLSAQAQLIVSARYFDEKQRNNYLVTDQNMPQVVKGTTKETDWGIHLQYIVQLKNAFSLNTRLYFNRYSNNSDALLQKDNTPFDALRFLQQIAKPEIQMEKAGKTARYIAGAGAAGETVDASRYNSKHHFTTLYAFTQEEWKLKGFTVIAGARADKRNDFGWRISPKLAVSNKPNDKLFLTASAGRGYRTPDVRQSYALFTNASVGYTLLGATILQTGLEKLKKEGQLDTAAQTGMYQNMVLAPETSTGINLGLRYTPAPQWALNANFFRNDLKNLIDRFTLPFQKNNGQLVYSYVNIHKVYTQGAAADVWWKYNRHFVLSGGYQYLTAKDKDVINGIKKARYLKRDVVTYRTDTVNLKDYGGLLYRSKHTANAKLMYSDEPLGLTAWVRVNYTGRFGYTEKNGSGILDDASEYAKGFFLCNVTAGKRVCHMLEVQTGIENLFDYRSPALMPNLGGRIYFLNLSLDFNKIITTKKQKA